MLMLDTDVVIDIQRGHDGAVSWFSALQRLPLLPGLVLMELIQGAPNKAKVREVVQLMELLPLTWPTEKDCELALENFTRFHLSHRLGLIDSLIAAMAIGRAAVLCTFNRKHYECVPDLLTAQYER